MIILKPIIFYPDYAGCEATWVDRIQAPDVEITEVPATFDEEGNELTAVVPARTDPGQITDTQVKCHSYHPTQMDMLRADALLFATLLDEYEDQITEMENGYVEPILDPEEVLALERSNARIYLNSTDWYFARLAETGELVPEAVLTKRAEARNILQ